MASKHLHKANLGIKPFENQSRQQPNTAATQRQLSKNATRATSRDRLDRLSELSKFEDRYANAGRQIPHARLRPSNIPTPGQDRLSDGNQ
ncbi:hypothetical protein C2U68_18560 [Methylomonas koyamae]|nr:hypothetical protein C2U68_18560 [Methylomonas koyamae]